MATDSTTEGDAAMWPPEVVDRRGGAVTVPVGNEPGEGEDGGGNSMVVRRHGRAAGLVQRSVSGASVVGEGASGSSTKLDGGDDLTGSEAGIAQADNKGWRQAKWDRVGFVVLLLAAGIVTSVAFALATRSRQSDLRRSGFIASSTSLRLQLSVKVDSFVLGNDILGEYIRLVKGRGLSPDPFEFKAFSDQLLSRPNPAFGLEYCPMVLHKDRAAFEAESTAYWNARLGAGNTTNTTWPIMGRTASLDAVPEGEEDFYYPIAFVEPVEPNLNAINLNVLSVPGREAFLNETIESQQPRVSDPLTLVQDRGRMVRSVILISPINGTRDIIQSLIRVPSFLSASFDVVAPGINAVWYQRRLGATTYHWLGSARKTTSGETVMLGDPWGSPEKALSALEELQDDENEHFEEIVQTGFDVEWRIFVFTDPTFSPLSLSAVYAASVLLMLLFVMTAVFFVLTTRRRDRAIRDRQRTIASVAEAKVQAERGLNQFLAHEVRNPLSMALSANFFVLGNISSVDFGSDPAAQELRSSIKSDLTLIGSSLNFICELLNQMLDLSKFESGSVNLKPRLMSVRSDVILPVRDMLSQSSSPVAFEIVCEEEFWVFADVLRLKQVLMNLAKNSSKFTTRGFIRLVCFRTPSDPATIVLAVEDSGPGIPDDKHAEIFRKFQTSLDRLQQGAGIGLALCKMIVDDMKGTIKLDPSFQSGVEGCIGTRFEIRLPLPRMRPPLEKLDELATQPHSHSRELNLGRVLVVDDDATVRQINIRMLRSCARRAQFDEASSGEVALRMIAQNSYDIVIMDHYMPGPEGVRTGEETIRCMRDSGFQGLIVGCSANDMSRQHLLAGANLFWRKPINRATILQELSRQLPILDALVVLVVDDSNLSRAIISRMLARVMPNARFVEAATVDEAVAAFDTEGPHVVTMDEHLGLAGPSGTEVATILRNRGTPCAVVGISGNNDNFASAEDPFDLAWPKPLPPVQVMKDSLRNVLLDVLRARDNRDVARANA